MSREPMNRATSSAAANNLRPRIRARCGEVDRAADGVTLSAEAVAALAQARAVAARPAWEVFLGASLRSEPPSEVQCPRQTRRHCRGDGRDALELPARRRASRAYERTSGNRRGLNRSALRTALPRCPR